MPHVCMRTEELTNHGASIGVLTALQSEISRRLAALESRLTNGPISELRVAVAALQEVVSGLRADFADVRREPAPKPAAGTWFRSPLALVVAGAVLAQGPAAVLKLLDILAK